MKRYNISWMLVLLITVLSSCKDYLDINTNPNQATSVQPLLVLPAAITGTASVSNQFNSYGLHLGGYMANAGGFSGFGNLFNYQIIPADYNALWVNTYDNLNDYKYVIDQTEGDDTQAYANAVANIMVAYNFQKLVDAFGDVPYTEALQNNANLTPKYDDAATIYQDLVTRLDAAIALTDAAEFPTALTSSSDPMFAGDMTKWKRFANTIKLRILVRISGVASLSSFVTTKFAALDKTLGFITDDAIVNPGYVKDKPNPVWNSWGYTTTGTLANSSRIPTEFAFGFYKGQKLTDTGRGNVIYKNFETNTPVNQLGNEVDAPTIITNYSTWYTGTFSSASSIGNALGVLKGAGQGQVLMLLAEAQFLQAEARLKGFITGDYAASFDAGIAASFTYLYKDVTNVVAAGKNVTKDVAGYKAENAASYLVNIKLATTAAQRLEAIITQKWIAVNMINSEEGYNEFRRTGYPVTQPNGDGFQNIASLLSTSTRADKLPSRILYPTSEQSYNAGNYRVINPFTDLIFWDPN
ncbi:SusD/RagB family nutrient-binding outer membrane lipoprotein [Dyadobacter chenwenxiniae]|uniref:SusD/RagB family nutrient-binding outer membrane lipoprotein n=1 Tax=Dyadobacter chenwenxiniae TaxID=2906456 RepID=A0A9X1PQC7_9BACT|nr:SusD/RagB family nutrient-binding outer membrane lipoprotein [Dyadobacter chenwenxiniae]MCF0064996.1 SusD/RagB family nutrient-binding outer membrane lipoprotein [Dyadobacter chenwenxiniae]UON83115.1 SusD/RagB family nutrient-binding outer membrane lipoprotein [Dyadobacter chenwenxiniae]